MFCKRVRSHGAGSEVLRGPGLSPKEGRTLGLQEEAYYAASRVRRSLGTGHLA